MSKSRKLHPYVKFEGSVLWRTIEKDWSCESGVRIPAFSRVRCSQDKTRRQKPISTSGLARYGAIWEKCARSVNITSIRCHSLSDAGSSKTARYS